MINIKNLLDKMKSNKKVMVGSLVAGIFVVVAPVFVYRSIQQNLYIAQVDDHAIKRSYFDSRLNEQLYFFSQADQTYDSDVLSEQLLAGLIDEAILESYASENDLLPTDDEVHARYEAVVDRHSSEDELLARLQQLYAKDKPAYLDTIRNDLIRESVNQSLEEPLSEWLAVQRSQADIRVFE